MQPVSPGFIEHFLGPVMSPEYCIELLASSGFNFPEGTEISASASSVKNTYRGSGTVDAFFSAANLGDGQSGEPIKYMVLDQPQCKLGSGYCLAGEGAKFTPGWWSEIRSDANGNYASPPYVEISYSPAIEANRIRVSTTTAYPGAHTVNIQVRYEGAAEYDDLGDFAFGTGDRVVADLGSIKRIAKIRVAVKRTKAVESYARLTEVEPVLEWSAETLGSLERFCEDVRIRKSSGSISSYSPAAPGFGVNELTFALSKNAPLVPEENQLVMSYMGFAGELLLQGVYVISEVNEGVDAWNVTAHGLLSLAAYHRYPDTVWKDIKVSTAVKRLLEWIGIAEDGIISSLASDPVWKWYVVDGGQCDDVLRKAAEIFGLAIYETETGEIRVRSSYGASVTTITDSMISDISQTKPQEINCVVVYYGNIRQGAQDWILSGSADLGASETKTFIFRYSKSPCLDMMPPIIESFKDPDNQNLALPSIMSWSADAYSLTVTVRNNVATAGKFTVKVWGTPLETSSNEAIYEAKNLGSIRRRGLRPYESHIYTESSAVAKAYGDKLLNYLQACSSALKITVSRPIPHLQLRDVVKVSSAGMGIDADYVVMEIELADETRLTLIPKAAVV